MTITHLDSVCVVNAEGCARNLESSLARGLPVCSPKSERTDQLAVVGSGPSVRSYLHELHSWPGKIWAVNGAYNYLQDNGIVPSGFLGVDPLPGLAEYVQRPHPSTTFYMSGLCDPSVFNALAGHNVRLWFPEQESVKFPAGSWLVGGGTTALTRAPQLAKMLGFRDVTIFGADSSFDRQKYVYPDGTYQEDSKAPVNWVMVNNEGPFPTEICLLKQVSQFGVIMRGFTGKLTFKCGGLLDAYLRAPMTDEAILDEIENDRAA